MGSVEKHGKGILNEGAFSHTETFALAIAMLCVGRCNALRWRLQCFALADAMLCVGGCNALRWRLQCFASEIGKTGTEIVSHILDKRKGRKLTIYGSL